MGWAPLAVHMLWFGVGVLQLVPKSVDFLAFFVACLPQQSAVSQKFPLRTIKSHVIHNADEDGQIGAQRPQ